MAGYNDQLLSNMHAIFHHYLVQLKEFQYNSLNSIRVDFMDIESIKLQVATTRITTYNDA